MYLPQGLAAHLSAHARANGGELPKNKRAATQARAALNDYLQALSSGKNIGDARKITTKVQKLQEQIVAASLAGQWLKVAEYTELRNRLGAMVQDRDLESMFIQVAKEYSDSQGISYETWVELHVPARVLKEAGITKASKKRNGHVEVGDEEIEIDAPIIFESETIEADDREEVSASV